MAIPLSIMFSKWNLIAISLFVQNIALHCLQCDLVLDILHILTHTASHTPIKILWCCRKMWITKKTDQLGFKILTIKFCSHEVNLRSIKISNFTSDVINTFTPVFFPLKAYPLRYMLDPNMIFVRQSALHSIYSSFLISYNNGKFVPSLSHTQAHTSRKNVITSEM